VVDVWETAEQFDAFAATRLMPGVHKVGVLGEPVVEILPAHALYAPGYRTGPGATRGDLEAGIRRCFEEVVNEGNYAVIEELFAPEFVSTAGDDRMTLAGFTEFVKGWRAGFSDIHCSVENVIVQGDRLAWTVRATGTHDGAFMGIPATGRTVDFLSVNEGRAREDGKFVEHLVVMDTGSLLMQLGVLPPMPTG
jgi:predicted ester cyclase